MSKWNNGYKVGTPGPQKETRDALSPIDRQLLRAVEVIDDILVGEMTGEYEIFNWKSGEYEPADGVELEVFNLLEHWYGIGIVTRKAILHGYAYTIAKPEELETDKALILLKNDEVKEAYEAIQ